MMRVGLILALLAPLALAACGPAKVFRNMMTGDQSLGTPQPFRGVARNEALLRAPLLRGGLVVAPVDWLEDADEDVLRRAVAEALRAEDVAATLDEADRAPFALILERDGEDVVVRLAQAGAEDLGSFRADGLLSRPVDWADFGAAAGRETARRISELEGGETPERAFITVAVTTMSGAPADGDDALPRALRAVLAQGGPVIGYRMVPADADAIPEDAFRIEGVAVAAPEDGGGLRIRISWRLLAPDGEVVGAVTQSNALPPDALRDGWGPAAFDAAFGAAEGLGALLDRARSAMETPPTADQP